MSMSQARIITLAIQQALLDLDIDDVKASIGELKYDDQPIQAAILHIKEAPESPVVEVYIDINLDIFGVGSAWRGVFTEKASMETAEQLAAKIKARIPSVISQRISMERLKKLQRKAR